MTGGHRIVVLLVDDQPIIGESVRRMLRNEPTMELHVCLDARQALTMAVELSPTVILQDLVMPDVDGLELVRALRSEEATRHVPLIVLSVKEEPEVKAECFRLGANDYLVKLPSPIELIARIQYHSMAYVHAHQTRLAYDALKESREQLRARHEEIRHQRDMLAERTEQLKTANASLEEKTRELSEALDCLKKTQQQLVLQGKLASLGMLISGIAHEIKNPLNFVNNFARLSTDLCAELLEVLEAQRTRLDPQTAAAMEEMVAILAENTAKIEEHGERADGIVHAMQEHSGGSAGQMRQVDLNALVHENVTVALDQPTAAGVVVQMNLADAAGMVSLVPEDIGRVVLNLVINALYELNAKKQQQGARFVPQLCVSTCDLGEAVEVRVRDNGRGIPEAERDKIFHPFFTTKPPGDGTGLGLSLSYEIVTQGHGGRIGFESAPGQFTEFVVTLPRNIAD